MASKLTAARMASWSGIRCVIGRADRDGILAGAVSADLIGTTFAPHDRTLSARKLWIAFAADVAGSIRVDAGARSALVNRPNSLLPAGVVGVDGSFNTGDVVDVVDPGGVAFARGRVSMSDGDLRPVVGRHTRDLPDGMVHEIVHRDDLVVLEPVTEVGARFNPR
jgi:glutamate 5-kinase